MASILNIINYYIYIQLLLFMRYINYIFLKLNGKVHYEKTNGSYSGQI